VVAEVPYEIDGLQKYIIKCQKHKMMKVSRDGRPWKTWCTTTRLGFHGVRRRAKCGGSYMCTSESCPFYAEHGAPNRVQFRKDDDGEYVCFSCESAAVHKECPALKTWEYHENLKAAIVYHVGEHTCVCKPRAPNRKEVDTQELDAAAASDVEPMVMPADRMRQPPRRCKDNDRKKGQDLDTVVSSDDEDVYMASSRTHRPPKRRKKIAGKNAHEMEAAAAAASDKEHTYTPQVAAHRPPKARKKDRTTASSVAAATRSVAGSLRMHLRTVRKRNVRLQSPGAAVGITATSHICHEHGKHIT